MAAGVTVGIALGRDDRNDDNFTYSIGLRGDLPYSDEQALTGVPNLIADMNRSNIEFAFTMVTSRPATERPAP